MPRILREKARFAKTGVPDTSWRRLMARGEAPLPVTIGKISKGWVEDELDEWVRGRIAERDGVAAKPTAAKARSPRKPRPAAAVGEETSGAETCR